MVVVTHGGFGFVVDLVAKVGAIGIQRTDLVVAVKLLFCRACRYQGIGMDTPLVGDSLCTDCDLLETYGSGVSDGYTSIGSI